jgi:Tol biopolymer transport system component
MPAWHPVRNRIAFVDERNGFLDLFEFDIETPSKAFPVLKPNDADEIEPAYSPCGSHLVFATNAGHQAVRAGSRDRTYNLWVIAKDGDVMKLTHGNAVARHPAWTPRRIWYESDILDPAWVRGLQVPGAFLGELYGSAQCPESLDRRR